MAIVVEDGTGKTDAESYASVAAFKTYCDARAVTYGTDSAIEAQLRKATDHIGEAYRLRWAGERVSTTQALDFPRYNVPRRDIPGTYYDSDTVPAEIARACIELAIRAASVTLTPDETQAIKRRKVGPIETEYQDYSRPGSAYPAIDRLVAPLLSGGGGTRLVRG